MLVSNLDIIQLEIVGEMQGQVVRNVFHYEILHAGGGAIDIDDTITLWFVDFDTEVLKALATTLEYNNVVGKNLSNPVQIFEGGVSATGDLAGDALPVHDTYSVKLIRTSGITRNGRKSFSGVVESQNVNGLIVLGAPEVEDIENFCSDEKIYATLSDPSVDVTYRPVIVGRTETTPGNYVLDLSKINTIKGAQMHPRVRTQNTRKP